MKRTPSVDLEKEQRIQVTMIVFSNLSQHYGTSRVIDRFSGFFRDTGLYLLLGESGSGKTTFLNLLAGFVPFSEGEVRWDGKTFQGRVTHEDPAPFDYITQDPVFIDYLSTEDNLRILGGGKKILPLLRRFGLAERKNAFPPTLSGGERQRLAIIRSLLKGKKVLLLDEPTAALDPVNKKAVFETLAALKNEVLIICATHDQGAADYADAIVHFSKKDKTPWMEEAVPEEEIFSHPGNEEKSSRDAVVDSAAQSENHLPNPLPFLARWFTSSRREKRAERLFLLFLSVSLLLLFLADTPAHKLAVTCEKMYRINVLELMLTKGTRLSDLSADWSSVSELVVNYRGCVPDEIKDPATGEVKRLDSFIYVLPEKKDLFRLADELECGSYFTAPEQVILSYEMAETMRPGNHEKLIGKTLTRTFYGLGSVDLEIVGILNQLDERGMIYMNACGADYTPDAPDSGMADMLLFVNAALIRDLEQDEDFFMGEGQRGYFLYFDSFSAFESFYQTYEQSFSKQDSWLTRNAVHHIEEWELPYLSWILLPFALLAALFTVIFFAEMSRAEFTYNNAFVSVFEYAGYARKRILRDLVLLGVLNFVKLLVLATAIALPLSILGNFINHRRMFTDYELFSYNPLLLAAYYVGAVLLTALLLALRFRRVKRLSWYENLIANRDVL